MVPLGTSWNDTRPFASVIPVAILLDDPYWVELYTVTLTDWSTPSWFAGLTVTVMLYMFARMSSVLLESRVTGNVPLTQYPKYWTLIWTMPPTFVQFAHPFELETCICES